MSSLNGMGLRTVEDKTAAYTVVADQDTGKLFTNNGAAGVVLFSLPVAAVGEWYEFKVMANQELRIDPNGTETAALHTGVQQAAGKYLTSTTVGNAIRLVCTKAGQWEALSAIGTGWSAEA